MKPYKSQPRVSNKKKNPSKSPSSSLIRQTALYDEAKSRQLKLKAIKQKLNKEMKQAIEASKPDMSANRVLAGHKLTKELFACADLILTAEEKGDREIDEDF